MSIRRVVDVINRPEPAKAQLMVSSSGSRRKRNEVLTAPAHLAVRGRNVTAGPSCIAADRRLQAIVLPGHGLVLGHQRRTAAQYASYCCPKRRFRLGSSYHTTKA